MGFGSKRGGTRVPNVKLKPVPAPATTSTSINTTKPAVRASKGKGKQLSEVQPEPEAEDEEDQSLFRESLCREKPLLSGFVICFTGIPEPVKSQAIAYAQKLGAQTTGALTLDVTHLICDRPGSPKYYAAIDNRIKIMLPMWLEALYSSFTEGEDVDMVNITNRYTMKALHNLKFSLTGNTPHTPTPRTPFIQLAEDNGAAIAIDLDSSCTHLIVLAPPSSTQVDSSIFDSEKLQAARKADPVIKIVWQEWLEDSVDRGGCLPESTYLVREGVSRPGRLCSRAGSASRACEVENDTSQSFRVNQLENAITKKITRTSSQTAMLASIISERDLPPRGTLSRVRSMTSQLPTPDVEQDLPDLDFHDSHRSGIMPPPASRNPGSAAPLTTLLDQSKSVNRVSLVKKLSSVRSSKFDSPSTQLSSQPSSGLASRTDWNGPDLFRNLTISIAGCTPNHRRIVTQAVTECGARVISAHVQADYTIVPHINPSCIPAGCNPVSPCWVELSLYTNKVIDPDHHWATRPVRLPPISNPDQYAFTSCGFDIVELTIIRRALKVLNLRFIECPRRKEVTHVFIGPDKNSTRLQVLKTWTEKQMIDFDWLINTLGCGERITSGKATNSSEARTDQRIQSTPLDVPHPLVDCVIYLSKRALLDRNCRSVGLCRKLGARIVVQFDDSITHLVHVGEKSNEMSREFKLAKSKGLHIVHPCWLTECAKKQCRAEELTFLHTYKPGLALDYEASPLPTNALGHSFASEDVDVLQSPPEGYTLQLDLQEDDTFFQLQPPVVTDDDDQAKIPEPSLPGYGRDTAVQYCSSPGLERAKSSILDSQPDIESGDLREDIFSPNVRSRTNAFTSPHTSDLARTSSPAQSPVPGVNTQYQGFIEKILQQPPALGDISRDKPSRRNRKRGLADLSRTNSGSRSARALPGSGFADGTTNTSLHRTLSDLSHVSPTRSEVPFATEEFEESMRITWDEAIPKKIASRRTEQRKALTHTATGINGSTDTPNLACPPELQPQADKVSKPVLINVESDSDAGNEDADHIQSPPLKRRRPRLA